MIRGTPVQRPLLRCLEETLSDLWSALTDCPLPPSYDFRMRPATS